MAKVDILCRACTYITYLRDLNEKIVSDKLSAVHGERSQLRELSPRSIRALKHRTMPKQFEMIFSELFSVLSFLQSFFAAIMVKDMRNQIRDLEKVNSNYMRLLQKYGISLCSEPPAVAPKPDARRTVLESNGENTRLLENTSTNDSHLKVSLHDSMSVTFRVQSSSFD